MRRFGFGVLVVSVALVASACATSEEWATWRAHPTHFASSPHLTFSIRHRDGVAPRVTRQDIARARAEAWWGKPVTVSPDQIIEQ